MAELSATWPANIWVIGCGNMGGAIVRAWLDNGAPLETITVIVRDPSRQPPEYNARSDYPDGETPDLVLLAMKPHQLDEVAALLAPLVSAQTQVVSALAGTGSAIVGKAFPKAGRIIRLMPNMAVTVAKSPMLLFSENADDELRAQMEHIFAPLGPPVWLEDEAQMHIATALCGSGPAFIFRVIDALTTAATDLGMDKDQAARLALAMTDGAATLAAGADVNPGTLADRVASPGGVTREGLNVLDADNRVMQLMHDVLKAAMERDMEMAAEAAKKA